MRNLSLIISALMVSGCCLTAQQDALSASEKVINHDRWDANTEDQNHAELSTFYASELYNRTGEIRGGMGLRGRYWFSDIGVEVQGLSLAPRDSIVDRSDLSVCWRYEFAGRQSEHTGLTRAKDKSYEAPHLSAILSAGYGSNWEDHAHGPGIGVAVQYNRGNWFMEAGTRAIWEDHSKSLLTFGVGRRF